MGLPHNSSWCVSKPPYRKYKGPHSWFLNHKYLGGLGLSSATHMWIKVDLKLWHEFLGIAEAASSLSESQWLSCSTSSFWVDQSKDYTGGSITGGTLKGLVSSGKSHRSKWMMTGGTPSWRNGNLQMTQIIKWPSTSVALSAYPLQPMAVAKMSERCGNFGVALPVFTSCKLIYKHRYRRLILLVGGLVEPSILNCPINWEFPISSQYWLIFGCLSSQYWRSPIFQRGGHPSTKQMRPSLLDALDDQRCQSLRCSVHVALASRICEVIRPLGCWNV